MQKRLMSLVMGLLMMFLCSCSSNETPVSQYDDKSNIDTLSSGVVCENNMYFLEWNDTRKCVLLHDKNNGNVWSTVPYDFLNSDIKFNRHLDSPINVTCFNEKDKSVTEISGYSYAVSSGRVGCEKISNGIKVTYYFDKYQLSIPVSYTLFENSLRIVVETKEIIENDYKIVSISIAPNLCSVKNNADDSYLFVPAGSGALMDTYELGKDKRKFIGHVYGEDKARILTDTWADEEKISLPIFGSRIGNTSMFGIIKSHSAALIMAEAGNSETGYSSIYPKFEMRGYDVTTSSNLDFSKYADEMSINEDIIIDYYILSGDKVGYAGMVDIYRNYLIEEYKMEKSNQSQPYLLTFYGGAKKKEQFLGVPYSKLSISTTYDDIKEIVNDIINSTMVTPEIQMVGFSSQGTTTEKLAGGYKLSNKFGNISNLLNWLTEKEISYYVDFDIINYNKSTSGFSTLFDAAKTANLQRMYVQNYSIDVHSVINGNGYYLLSRQQIDRAVKKLNSYLEKKNISGVSLGTMGSIAYSDYSDEQFYTKGNIRSQISNCLEVISKNDRKILLSKPNDYAATCSDVITDIDFNSGDYSVFSSQVPFYQMVFCGYKPMYSSSVNLNGDVIKFVLNNLSTGIKPTFSVINEYDLDFAKNQDSLIFSRSVYKNNRETIIKTVELTKEYNEIVSDASIINYEVQPNGIIVTTYDNGVVTYVNASDVSIEYNGYTIEANDLFVLEGE